MTILEGIGNFRSIFTSQHRESSRVLVCSTVPYSDIFGLKAFSASRILLLDLMFTSSQMNSQTLINFLYIILLISKLWIF